jgi:AbiV family abortive infection protein
MKLKMSAAEALHGVGACEENAKRLLRNAVILLDHGGSDGLTYMLWSFAVEEFGKAVLFARQAKGKAPDDILDVDIPSGRGEHSRKFQAGFDELSELHGTQLAWLLRVRTNANTGTTTIDHPGKSNVQVSVGGGMTGVFTTEDAKEDPTAGLRNELLYVDWNSQRKEWIRLGTTYTDVYTVARWELDRDDLRRAIDALWSRVEQQTT